MRFGWLGPGRMPAGRDLRRCGWGLERDIPPDAGTLGNGCVGLLDLDGIACPERGRLLLAFPFDVRRFILVTGVDRADERAALLEGGFGDALDVAVGLDELCARAGRVAELTRWVPRLRLFGELKLDLLAREAYRAGRPLNLNPREFTLLWRLADSPNQPVSKQLLVRDVWRMGFVPATNSIAVHMSRLRRKLGFAGLDGIIETASEGGYCLRIPDLEEPLPSPAGLAVNGSVMRALAAMRA